MVSRLGEVDGFELSIGRVWDLDREGRARPRRGRAPVRRLLTRTSASARSCSTIRQRRSGRLERNCRLAAALGATIVVLHLWELPVGDRRLEENLALLPACLDVAETFGLTLAVETIPCSVDSPLENVHRAIEADERCRVTLDTEFLALHGQLEAALADDVLWERVAHVHVKDYAGGSP